MSDEILTLQPSSLWKYFFEITQIPRPSKHEEKIIEYLENFAKNNNLDYSKDEIRNIVIRKKATTGYENAPDVCLQSHVDMVCEKHSNIEIDFLNDPINPYIDGDFIKAKGTTLGADNGIGMAIQLAILADSSLQHGNLECLFTVDEETGLTGAFELGKDMLKSEILINLDSEDDGEFFIGCAGGAETTGYIDIETENVSEDYSFFKISVFGLKGGHSGDDIHKGHGNANKILNRFLWEQQNNLNLKLSLFDGGNLRNAIAREAFAIAGVPDDKVENLKELLTKYSDIVKKELFVTDNGVDIAIEKTGKPNFVFTENLQKRLLNLIYVIPHGVIAWSQDIPNFVETSTNLASVKILDDKIKIVTSQRSSVESAKNNICQCVAAAFELADAKYEHGSSYPGWTPNPQSYILEVAKRAYKKLFGAEPVVRAIHAGLECGLFTEKYPDIDIISIGPDIKGAHSPDERLSISSTQRFWKLTLDILKKIK